ncbi:PepSY-associated TM helix domain-containing protein [Croceicoccus bisphenolivorans]|uniref:PepSY-associated TM helix domain-containing protein n=1 Tax=Croceicoccus bisphenolivorans TaxID=1783232 RepID=UPI000830315B|nr:PepSY-associated TM helix domain-containing protein [Croceicoccus bisphenolivorans]
MKPRTLLAIHRWIALAFAPFLILQAVTGAALLYRNNLSALIEPSRTSAAGEMAPLSQMIASAESAQPDKRLTRIFLPVTPNGTAFAQLEGTSGSLGHALLDPGNGEVLEQGTLWHFPLEAALQLHFRLNNGNWGLAVVCLYGLALVVIALTGLWHWWPGHHRVMQALRIPARTPKRLKLRAWHRSSGALLALALFVTSLTGVLTGVPSLDFGSTHSAPQPAFVPAHIDRAFAAAQGRFPDARPRDVRFRPDGSLAVNFFAPRGGEWAVDTVVASTADGSVVSATPYEANDALWTYTLPVHTGTIAGSGGRWLMLAVAAGLLFLAISGPLAWWRSRKKGKPAR